jgi:hypothetical protein
MPLLVTSAAGANGNGYGGLLAFDLDGTPLDAFSNDSRIADPRGLAVDRKEGLLCLNSGADRVLALDRDGRVVRDTGPIAGLNPGGGNFGPDGRYYVGMRSARTIMALAIVLDAAGEPILPPGIVPFPRGFASAAMAGCSLRPASARMARVTTAYSHSLQPKLCSRPGWLPIKDSARSISRSHPTATSSFPANARSARPTP